MMFDISSPEISLDIIWNLSNVFFFFIFGLLACFCGHRLTRFLAFFGGFVVGGAAVFSFFVAQTELHHNGVPQVLGLLGAMVVGILALLVPVISLGSLLGYIVAANVVAADNNYLFRDDQHRLILYAAAIVTCVSASFIKQELVAMLSTASAGAFIIALGVDHYSSKAFTSMVFSQTALDRLFGVEGVLPSCNYVCYIIIGLWLFLTLLGAVTQYILKSMSIDLWFHDESKPLLTHDERRSRTLRYSTFSKARRQDQETMVKAEFNYFDPKDLPTELEGLYGQLRLIFRDLATQFGFQDGNVENQSEHLLFLTANYASRSLPVDTLHAKIFNNYHNWCNFLNVTPMTCASVSRRANSTGVGSSGTTGPINKEKEHVRDSSHDTRRQIRELALWLLIWGEASTLRHCPESLCFIFHNMAKELQSDVVSPNSVDPQPNPTREKNAFLQHVITPIYALLGAEKGPLDKARNYDDWNEFFWSQDCLDYYYAERAYAPVESVEHGSRDEKESTRQTLSYGLQRSQKTYLERRSWLHPFRTFHRITSLLGVCFHLLVAIAFLDFSGHYLLDEYANKVLASCVLSLAFFSLSKEFLEIWATYGIISRSLVQTAGFSVRLALKSLALLYLSLFYIWSFERSAWYWSAFKQIAAVYLIPWACLALSALFPVLSGKARNAGNWFTALIKLWWPQNRLFVGRNVHVETQNTYPYQTFWVTMMVWKLFCSYHFQVKPLVRPTLHLLSAEYTAEVPAEIILKKLDIWNAPQLNYALIVLMWLPFVLVYVFDLVIWYSLWQAVVGAAVGLAEKVGQVRTFAALINVFTETPKEFDAKLMGKKTSKSRRRRGERKSEEEDGEETKVRARRGGRAPGRRGQRPGRPRNNGLNTESGSGSSQASLRRSETLSETDEENPQTHVVQNVEHTEEKFQDDRGERGFHSTKWKQWSLAWNEVVADIRNSDLISNQEAHLLSFRYVPHGEKQFYLPLFLMAGLLDRAMDECKEKAQRFKKETDKEEKANVERELAAFFFVDKMTREAVTEVWELLRWLLQTLLGDKHEGELDEIFGQMYGLLRRGLLQAVDMDKIHEIKPALSNLVRGLRLSFTLIQKMKQRDDHPAHGSSLDIKQNSLAVKKKKQTHDIAKDSFAIAIQRARDIRRMKGMLKSASKASLAMLDRIGNRKEISSNQTQAHTISLHVDLIRDQLRKLLSTLANLVQGMDAITEQGGVSVGGRLKAILGYDQGFLWDDRYASQQLVTFCETPRTEHVLETLYKYLTVAKIDAQPSSSEAQRRLLFFVNSLFMNIPQPLPVKNMYSWTTLTPFYSEDILYSYAELERETEDGFSTFFYLQTIYPKQWNNFLQRIEVQTDNPHDPAILRGDNETLTMEARLWATRRGQTLYRTVDGMMLYDKALRLLAQLEQPDKDPEDLRQLCKQKFQYVVSCQVYGKQKREMDPKAKDIEYLLYKFPNLRVAYIDSTRVPKKDKNGKTIVVEEFYSVLIKAVPTDKGYEIREVFRVKLPGNPMLGEGKPENQNHAIIFTRGEYLQAIDMNQDNYFEEALKIRNLLQDFQTSGKPVGIVGFREQIFTGSLSSVANYMALQESCFVTLGQRVLNNPLQIRMHYGHPDMFDKLMVMQKGGMSKASRGINLSEDIFSGFNCVLRGGEVAFREYVQVGKGRDVGLQQLFKFEAKLAQGAAMQTISRDVYRLANSLDIFRLFSFFYGQLGFYLTNSLTIWALYLFLFSRLFVACLGYEESHAYNETVTIGYWFGQIAFLLTLPIYAALSLEKGFWNGTVEVLRMLGSGGPLYFMFQIGTKAHFYEFTMLAGGASYRATGRGFVTKHESFPEMYRFFAASHFYKACELSLLMILYGFVKSSVQSYMLVTWSGWLVVFSWIFAPLWFNPMAFEWEKTVEDAAETKRWMSRREGDGDQSWECWWREEHSYLKNLGYGWKIILVITSLRYALVGLALVYYHKATYQEIVISASLIGAFGVIYLLMREQFSIHYQMRMRAVKAGVGVFLFFAVILFIRIYTLVPFTHALFTIVALGYFAHSVVCILFICGARWTLIRRIYQLHDYAIAYFMLGITGLMSMLLLPSRIQTRLMFHNAFSRGVLIDKLLHAKKSWSGSAAPPPPPPPPEPASALPAQAPKKSALEGDEEMKHPKVQNLSTEKPLKEDEEGEEENGDDDGDDEEERGRKPIITITKSHEHPALHVVTSLNKGNDDDFSREHQIPQSSSPIRSPTHHTVGSSSSGDSKAGGGGGEGSRRTSPEPLPHAGSKSVNSDRDGGNSSDKERLGGDYSSDGGNVSDQAGSRRKRGDPRPIPKTTTMETFQAIPTPRSGTPRSGSGLLSSK